jgi:hypothetical protein
VRPEDELAIRIRQYVAANVPPEQVEIVTRTVCLTLAMLMAEPAFTNELAIVKALRDENHYIKTQYAILKETLSGVKPATAKSAPRKRSPAKKRAAPRVSGGTAQQRAAFREGFRGTSGA